MVRQDKSLPSDEDKHIQEGNLRILPIPFIGRPFILTQGHAGSSGTRTRLCGMDFSVSGTASATVIRHGYHMLYFVRMLMSVYSYSLCGAISFCSIFARSQIEWYPW